MDIAFRFIRSQASSIILGLLAIAIAIVKSCWIMTNAPMPSWIWGALACVGLIAALFLGGKPQINPILLALLGACLLSIGVNDPDPVFRSYQRFGYFALSLALLSPLLNSVALRMMRRVVWLTSLLAMRLAVVGSLVAYILYNLRLIPHNTVVDLTIGTLSGVTAHHILLSILAAIVALVSLNRLIFVKGINAKKFAAHAVMASVAIFVMLLAGSRIAAFGFLAASVVDIGFGLTANRRQTLLGISAVGMLASAILIINGISSSFAGFNNKIDYYEERGGQLSSRIDRWTDRIDEFVDSPIVGIGFCAQTRSTSPYDDPMRIFGEGHLEPGSSWLAVASMTGILGLALMLLFNVSLLIKLCRRKNTPRKALWLSLLVILWIHGMAEGWVYFAGSYLHFIYWLVCGLAWPLDTFKPLTAHEDKRIA